MASAMTQEVALRLSKHHFSAVDDPFKKDKFGHAKWFQFGPKEFVLNPEYRAENFAAELVLMTGQYVEDQVGALGREMWEKQAALTESEKDIFWDLREIVPPKETLEAKEPQPKVVLESAKFLAGCSHDPFKLNVYQQIILTRIPFARLPAAVIFAADQDNARLEANVRPAEALYNELSAPNADFKRVLSKFFTQLHSAEPSGEGEWERSFKTTSFAYTTIRRVGQMFGLEKDIRSTDSFAVLIALLLGKVTKTAVDGDKLRNGYDKQAWDFFRTALKSKLPLKGEEKAKPPKEPQETKEEEESKNDWPNFENAWQGPCIHVMLSHLAHMALQIGLLPPAVTRFGVKAFGVIDSPDPATTLKVLLDNALCLPTLIVMTWTSEDEYDDTLWDMTSSQLNTTILNSLTNSGKKEAEKLTT
jgi:hypothetical protein